MKTIVLVLLLNTWQGDGKGAVATIAGFTSVETCKAEGEKFKSEIWAQYYYCVDVK